MKLETISELQNLNFHNEGGFYKFRTNKGVVVVNLTDRSVLSYVKDGTFSGYTVYGNTFIKYGTDLIESAKLAVELLS